MRHLSVFTIITPVQSIHKQTRAKISAKYKYHCCFYINIAVHCLLRWRVTLCCMSIRFDDFYFLTEPREFINSHFPDEENWQLLDTPISLEQFERIPLKTSAFYTLGLTLLQPTQYKITTGHTPTHVQILYTK